MSWNNLRWGVELISEGRSPVMLGTLWHGLPAPKGYEGEPPRALLFMTRKQAREWCRAKEAVYVGRTDGCGAWRFRAVRVRETVKLA